MAYNNYYPATYQPYNYQQIYQPMQQQANQQQSDPRQLQIQNGGFVSVRSRVEAQNYPIAPGNSVTFKDETAPFVYTKTMGFSQLDRPVFEVFRLVKEEAMADENTLTTESNNREIDLSDYVTKSEIASILSRIEALEEKSQKKKRGATEDE